jgi:acyl-CoA thioester hydrolase
MARIQIPLPDTFLFSTELGVRITDINYGGHLANDALLSLIHEARVQFLKHFGFTEFDVAGSGIIMTDSATLYKAEVFYGDRLIIEIGIGDPYKYGCDIFYKVSNKETGKEVARVKTGIAFFDYQKRKLAEMPEKFKQSLMLSSEQSNPANTQ